MRAPLPPVDDNTRPGMLYSAELAQQVEDQARRDTELPAWFWVVAPIVMVGVIAASAAWPWGVAQ